MDFGFVLDFMYETAYFLAVFMLFMIWATFKGRQAMINIIFGLYLALLILIQFPYTDYLTENLGGSVAQSIGKLVLFSIFTILATWLYAHVMPDEFREKKFESFFKKVLLAGSASILVMVFSFQVLPVTEFLTPGTPLQTLFAPGGLFFWWLMVPLVILFLI
jgi:fumarate reductase subunit D